MGAQMLLDFNKLTFPLQPDRVFQIASTVVKNSNDGKQIDLSFATQRWLINRGVMCNVYRESRAVFRRKYEILQCYLILLMS
jgi:hypothetical protein